MYRRPKFLEVLLDIRQDMARLADYDVDLFVEMARSGKSSADDSVYDLIESIDDRSTAKTTEKHVPSKAAKTD